MQRWKWKSPDQLVKDLNARRVAPQQVKQAALNDPVGWIEAVFSVQLWDKQKEIVNALFKQGIDRLAVPASFSVGKTFIAACCVLYFLYNYTPSKVITIAPTWRQVFSLLWREIRKLHKRALENGWGLQGNLLKTELTIDEDWFAMGFSTQTADEDAIDRITGFHQVNMLVVFDQAGGLAPLWWTAVKSMLTGAVNKWIAFGNTAIYNCVFRRVATEGHFPGIGKWHTIKITAFDSPNVKAKRIVVPGLVSWDWLQDIAALGEDDPLYRIFALAEFVPSSDLVLIPPATVEALRVHWTGFSEEVIAVGGLDVAMEGQDWSVFTLIDRQTGQLLLLKRIRGNRTTTLVDFVKTQINRFKSLFPSYTVQAVAVDAIGVGAGVYDRLIEKLDPPTVVYPVIGSESPSDTRKFVNRRAEFAWALRERAQSKRLGLALRDERLSDLVDRYALQDLLEELANMPYTFDRKSKIKLLSKQELKPIFGRSPDTFDALVYACATSFLSSVSGITVVNTQEEPQERTLVDLLEDDSIWQEL